jgi:hypothetical protein
MKYHEQKVKIPAIMTPATTAQMSDPASVSDFLVIRPVSSFYFLHDTW